MCITLPPPCYSDKRDSLCLDTISSFSSNVLSEVTFKLAMLMNPVHLALSNDVVMLRFFLNDLLECTKSFYQYYHHLTPFPHIKNDGGMGRGGGGV